MHSAIRISRYVNLLFGGLYAGFLVAVLFIEIALLGFSPEVYVTVEQVKHTNLNGLAAATITPSLGSGLVLLVLLEQRRSRPYYLTVAGVLCSVAALLITLLVNVPINAAQMTWSAHALPADWQAIRERWQLAHAARTVLAVAGLNCQLLAALWPAGRPSGYRPGR